VGWTCARTWLGNLASWKRSAGVYSQDLARFVLDGFAAKSFIGDGEHRVLDEQALEVCHLRELPEIVRRIGLDRLDREG